MPAINSYIAIANGVAANDGTGDTLRSGADAINTNFGSFATAINAQAVSQNSGMIGYATKAEMDADLARPEGTLALVTNDATSANNTTYRKVGAAGVGSWTPAMDRLVQVTSDLASTAAGKGAAMVGFIQSGTASKSRTL